jgi:hypothetical protein
MPTNDDVFPDRPGAETLDRNCLGCHLAETVKNQPALPGAAWEDEIEKMRTAYKAPINPEDVDAIVTYLVGTNGIARSKWPLAADSKDQPGSDRRYSGPLELPVLPPALRQ